MPKFKVSGSHTETMIEIAIEQMTIEAEYIFARANLEIAKLEAEGISTAVATSSVATTFANKEAFMSAWMRRNKGLVNELHSKMVATPITEFSKKNKKAKYQWVLDGGANHCGSCVEVNSLGVATMEEIINVGYGLPREGYTICNVGCRCMLEKAS